jgi:hypothetical protein
MADGDGVAHCGKDWDAGESGGEVADRCCDDRISIDGKMGAMLLGGADRQYEKAGAGLDKAGDLRPCEVF